MFASFTEKLITKQKIRREGVKETLSLFRKRKNIYEFKTIKNDLEEVHFSDRKLEVKSKGELLYIEERSLAKICSEFKKNYKVDYKKIKFGEIELYVVEEEKVKGMCLPFEGIAIQNKIFTSDHEGTIQHELQHTFESVLKVSHLFKSWEREYNAFLAEMIFSDSKKSLHLNYEEIFKNKWDKETEEHYENDIHYKARLQIVSDLYDMKIDKRSSKEEIKQGALILLNSMYKRKTGMSYEEIMRKVE